MKFKWKSGDFDEIWTENFSSNFIAVAITQLGLAGSSAFRHLIILFIFCLFTFAASINKKRQQDGIFIARISLPVRVYCVGGEVTDIHRPAGGSLEPVRSTESCLRLRKSNAVRALHDLLYYFPFNLLFPLRDTRSR